MNLLISIEHVNETRQATKEVGIVCWYPQYWKWHNYCTCVCKPPWSRHM